LKGYHVKTKTKSKPFRSRTLSAPNELDVLWGASAIAKAIGRNKRIVFYLLEHGKIPANKIGGRWCISRAQLADFFKARPRNAEAA
jgi:hypothetical protein